MGWGSIRGVFGLQKGCIRVNVARTRAVEIGVGSK